MNYPKERFVHLIKDGFNFNDFISDPQRYQQCGGCMIYYSQELVPLFLSCSHFVCEGCFNSFKGLCTFCEQYKGPATIKFQKYNKLMVLLDSIAMENSSIHKVKTYNFSVSLTDTQTYPVQLISGTCTFRQLLESVPFFSYTEERLKGRIILFVNGIGTNLQVLQKMALNNYNAYLKAQRNKTQKFLNLSSQKNMNTIRVHDRLKGGFLS